MGILICESNQRQDDAPVEKSIASINSILVNRVRAFVTGGVSELRCMGAVPKTADGWDVNSPAGSLRTYRSAVFYRWSSPSSKLTQVLFNLVIAVEHPLQLIIPPLLDLCKFPNFAGVKPALFDVCAACAT
jgi:hypothetical protein